MPIPAWRTELNKRKILLAIKLALGLVLVYVFIDTALIPARVASTDAADCSAGNGLRPSANIDSAAQQQNGNDTSNYNAIVEHNLFGGAGDNLSSAAVASTELPLILQGTISGPAQIARAVILDLSEKSNTPETYRIGDIVAQAKIVGIEADAVILSYNGQKQILKLSSRKSPGNNAVLSVPAATAAVSEDKGIDPVSVFENIMKNAVIEPYVVDGNTVGLRVSELAKLNLPIFAGIKENDVIQSINGQELTSKQKAFQIFKKARTKSKIDVELLRDQQTKNLSMPLR
jgi:type II secretion system protein C